MRTMLSFRSPISLLLILCFVFLELLFVSAHEHQKGLEPPLPKHPKKPVHGSSHLKFCTKAETHCPKGHVPYDAYYLTAYILTKHNDPYTGYYLFVSKHLNEYGQFTLTSKQDEAVIVTLDIPAAQADGFANGGGMKTWNADYPSLTNLGAVLGYGSNSSFILFDDYYNYYALSPTTHTGKYAKPAKGGTSAYAHFTGINAPKESSVWSIVYHTAGAPGHIFPVWYNPVWGGETYGSLWWFPNVAKDGQKRGFAPGALFGMSSFTAFETRFGVKEYTDFFHADVTPHSIHNFTPGSPNQPPP